MQQYQTQTETPAAVRSTDLFCLSVRQPWAWLICNAGKDVENRDWPTKFIGRVLIHAGKIMTRADYEACMIFCQGIPPYNGLPEYGRWWLPDYGVLREQCGGIVGETNIVGCVKDSTSPWFCGEYGFLLRNSNPLPFEPCKGALGFFKVHRQNSEVRDSHP